MKRKSILNDEKKVFDLEGAVFNINKKYAAYNKLFKRVFLVLGTLSLAFTFPLINTIFVFPLVLGSFSFFIISNFSITDFKKIDNIRKCEIEKEVDHFNIKKNSLDKIVKSKDRVNLKCTCRAKVKKLGGFPYKRTRNH